MGVYDLKNNPRSSYVPKKRAILNSKPPFNKINKNDKLFINKDAAQGALFKKIFEYGKKVSKKDTTIPMRKKNLNYTRKEDLRLSKLSSTNRMDERESKFIRPHIMEWFRAFKANEFTDLNPDENLDDYKIGLKDWNLHGYKFMTPGGGEELRRLLTVFEFTPSVNDRFEHFFSYTEATFYRNYMFIGHSKYHVNGRNSNYLLGLYGGIAIINLTFSIATFRVNIIFLTQIMIKKFVTFLVINETTSKHTVLGFIEWFNFYRISYFFGNWWKGFFRNHKIFKKHNSRAFYNYYFWYDQFPAFVFYLANPRRRTRQDSSRALSNELDSVRMPNLMIFDTDRSAEHVFNPILLNGKSRYFNLAYMKMITSLYIYICKFKRKIYLKKFIKQNSLFVELFNIDKKYFMKPLDILFDNFIKNLEDITTLFELEQSVPFSPTEKKTARLNLKIADFNRIRRKFKNNQIVSINNKFLFSSLINSATKNFVLKNFKVNNLCLSDLYFDLINLIVKKNELDRFLSYSFNNIHIKINAKTS